METFFFTGIIFGFLAWLIACIKHLFKGELTPMDLLHLALFITLGWFMLIVFLFFLYCNFGDWLNKKSAFWRKPLIKK